MPTKTWNHLGINDAGLNAEAPEFRPYAGEPLAALPAGVTVSEQAAPGPEPETGMGAEAAGFVKENANTGVSLRVAPGVKVREPVRLDYLLSAENPAVADNVTVAAGEGSEVTVVMSCRSAGDAAGFHGGLTKLYAAQGAAIHLVQVQLLGDGCTHFDNVGATADDDALIDVVQAELGAEKSYSGVKARLNGAGSRLRLDTIYFGDRSRALDFNYVADHVGRKTKCEISVAGALLDESEKTFRGTINFLRGAKRAKGRESEFNLLFSPKVRSRTAPLILCEEEDVEGQHAASTGKIDANRLFYLMSRGLSETDAKKLLIEAQFRPVTDRIPDEGLRGAIMAYVKERLSKLEPMG